MAKLVRPRYLLIASLALAWIFDLLFWNRSWGVSFPIFVVILLAAGLWQASSLKLQPNRRAWPLAALAVLLSLVSIWRAEPLTLFFTRAFAFLFLALFAASFQDGRWLQYSFTDFFSKLLGLVPSGLLALRDVPAEKAKRGKRSAWQTAAPVLRGLLLALPILLVLGALLASADAFFSSWLTGLLSFLNIENAAEYIFRAVYIFLLAGVIVAVLLYAFFRSKSVARSKDLLPPFLGFTEAATVLISVVLLFASFVVIQFRYFFGGLANIVDSPTALTYAQYARRGFAELVVVAFFTLVFFLLLSALTVRTSAQQRGFSGLGITLFVLIAVILVSAFQRLLLYEETFGFTRMRTFPHVFMIWLGLLLLALVVLEVLRKQRFFPVAILFAALGFVLTLPLLNVDAFIVRANVARQPADQTFDLQYLATLSPDALPPLVNAYRTVTDPDLRLRLAASIACYDLHNPADSALDWRSWSWPRSQADELVASVVAAPDFPSFTIHDEREWSDFALVGSDLYCYAPAEWD